MTISAFEGPVIGGFPSSPLSGMPANQNPETGPSLFHGYYGLLDPRGQFTYIPGENFGKKTYGLLSAYVQTVDQVPAAKTANNIATAQTATAGTAMTLVSSNTTGVTVSTSIKRGDTGATVTGLLALDSAMTAVAFGTSQTIQIWSPTTAVARNIIVTSNGDDSSGTYTIAGYDLYGFPMSEVMTGSNATTANGAKAFKYVASVTPGGTVNSTGATIGTGDVIGFPVRADRQAQTLIFYGNPATYMGGSSTASAQTVEAFTNLADIATSNIFAINVPFNGVVTAARFRTFKPAVTTGGATLALLINGTSAGVTGGALLLTATNTSATGATVSASSITAGNAVTAGQTIGFIASNVTAVFSVGSGQFEFTVQNTDLGGNSTFTAAVTTAATTTSGDTRGTISLPVASNGTNRLVVMQLVTPAAAGTATAIFGVTQA